MKAAELTSRWTPRTSACTKRENFTDDIKEVKFWVENEQGEKTAGDGIVKMEYPEGFFGEKDPFDLATDEEYQKYVKEVEDQLGLDG